MIEGAYVKIPSASADRSSSLLDEPATETLVPFCAGQPKPGSIASSTVLPAHLPGTVKMLVPCICNTVS